jgi:hypothetical protein
MNNNLTAAILNNFVNTELDDFIKNYDNPELSEESEYQTLAIEWICFYFKDFIEDVFFEKVDNFIEKIVRTGTHEYFAWSRIQALVCTMVIHNHAYKHKRTLLYYLRCHKSKRRASVIKAVGIIVSLLDDKDSDLDISIAYNVQHKVEYFEECILLYLFNNATIEKKIEFFRGYYDFHKEKLEYFDDTVFLLEEGSYYKNSFFLQAFSEIKSYILFKILSNPMIHNDSLSKDKSDIKLAFDEAFEKESNHSLNTADFDISFLKRGFAEELTPLIVYHGEIRE